MKNIILFILTIISFQLFSQTKDGGKEIKSDDIKIIKDFKPLLADAEKFTQAAQLPVPDSSKMKLKYTTSASLLKLPFIPANLKPVAMTKQDDATILQNNYIKTGFGTQLSPYFDAHFSNGRNDKIYYAVNAFHHSANSSKVEFKDFADNKIDGDVRLQFKKTTLGLNAGYKRNTIYYYGYNHEDTSLFSLTKNDVRQRYNLFTSGLWLQNAAATKAGINYKLSFNNKYFFTFYRDHENEFETSLLFSKEYKKIHTFSLGLDINLTSFKDSLTESGYYLVPIHPYYEYRKDNLFARAGLTLVAAKQILFYPDLYAEARLFDGQVIPYININGILNKNIAMNLTNMNPFLERNINRAIGKTIVTKAGVKGSIGNNFVYAAELAYRFIDFLPLFYPDSNAITKYEIEYSEDAGEFNPHVELGYRKGNRIAITLAGDYYKYNLDFFKPAFGYPDWKITLNTNYNIQDKILVNFDLFSASEIKHRYFAQPGRDVIRYTGKWVDANLSLTYNYKKNFAAFIQFNNIGASTYYRWFRYDSYGLMFKGGIIIKF